MREELQCRGSAGSAEGWTLKLVLGDDAEETPMGRQTAVFAVDDNGQHPEVIYEMSDSRPGGAGHHALLTEAKLEMPLRANFS